MRAGEEEAEAEGAGYELRANWGRAEAEAAREAMRPAEVNFIVSLGIVLVLFVPDRGLFVGSMIYNINRQSMSSWVGYQVKVYNR